VNDLARIWSLLRQLQGLVPMKMGEATAVWPGGVVNVTTATASHGLGRVPYRVLVMPQTRNAGDLRAAIDYYDEQDIVIYLHTTTAPSAGQETPVAWWAW
jgi:hypothetical protein